MVLAGAGSTIVAKLMTEQIVLIKNKDGEKKSDFHHPLVLSFLMFLGQFLFMPFEKIWLFFIPGNPKIS
jgi:hypothetical protein